jgi:hypothetical protein
MGPNLGGAVLFQAGHLPVIDDFSFIARNARWTDHEWLSGVIFYAVLATAGETGLVVLKYLLMGVSLCFVFLIQRRCYGSRPPVAGIALVLVAPVLVVGFAATIRSQAFSFPIFMLWLWILEGVRCGGDSPKRLFWLIPLAVLWGNLHGGVAMGFLATGVYGLSEALLGRPRGFAVHLLAGLAMLGALAIINPYGIAYMEFLFEAWTLDRTGITEWAPLLAGGLRLENLSGAILVMSAVGLAALGCRHAAGVRSGTGRDPAAEALAPSILLLLWSAMTLMSQRIQPFLGLTLAALLPALVAPLRSSPAWGRMRPVMRAWLPGEGVVVGLVLPAVLCGVGLFRLAGALEYRPLLATVVPSEGARGATKGFVYPVGAMHYLRESPYQGKLLNPFSQGEFLYWCLYPKFRVGSDGRYEEVYSSQQFWQVYDFFHQFAPGNPGLVRDFADQSGADFVLFRSSWRNFGVLANSPGWTVLYDDGVWGLVGKRAAREEHSGYEPARAQRRRRGATIGDFFDDFEAGPRRFAEYP